MFNRGKAKEDSYTSGMRVPICLKIISWFLIIVSVFQISLASLLASGISYLGDNSGRLILFGLLSLSSELHFAVYMFIMGGIALFCGIGLLRKNKLAWWVTLIYSIYYLSDGILLLKVHYVSGLSGCVIDILIILCLLWKKQTYNRFVADGGQREETNDSLP